MKKILVIENNEEFAEKIKKTLEAENELEGIFVDSLEIAVQKITEKDDMFDLVIFDSENFSNGNAHISFSQTFGKNTSHNLNILIIDREDNLNEIMNQIKNGACDYITKPFSLSDFILKIHNSLGVAGEENRKVTEVLEKIENEVGKDNIEELTPKEKAILKFFIRHPNEVISRETIFEYIWPFNSRAGSNVIDVHIKNLRKKIWSDRSKSLIETVWGGGYRFSLI
jgi:DNA-binding response OmpR family regulator